MPVVSNSTPLIHLAKIDRLDLLKEFFGEIFIPEAVYRECVLEGKGSEDSELIEKADWIKVVRIKDETLKKSLMLELDKGESEAIVLALEMNSELLLIDDYEGKKLQGH